MKTQNICTCGHTHTKGKGTHVFKKCDPAHDIWKKAHPGEYCPCKKFTPQKKQEERE